MRLPTTTEEAMAEAERGAAWMRTRFPDMLSWVNASYSGSLDFWTWVSDVCSGMFYAYTHSTVGLKLSMTSLKICNFPFTAVGVTG